VADHGQLINSRTYWTAGVDAKGKPIVVDTPPAGKQTPFGIGAGAAPASTQYQEQTYEDGTKILSHWDANQDQWVQDSVDVDRGLQSQYNQGQKGAQPDSTPKTVTTADGRVLQYEPKTDSWKEVGPPKEKAPDKPVEVGGSLVEKQPDGTYKPVYTPQAKPTAGTAPALNLPATRPGQMTDLSLVEAQANQFIAGVNADTSLNPQQRQAKITTYLETTVKPAAEQATREANAYAQQQQQRQQQADQRAQEATQRAQQTADRQTSTAERSAAVAERNAATAEGSLALNQRKFGYDAGQDAVKQAMDLIPNSVGSTFGSEFAAGLGTLAGGGGPINVSPSSITFNAPDFEALRNYHVDQALASLRGTASTGPAVPPGYPPAAPPAPGTPPAEARETRPSRWS
jgi:hypothetical protein